MPSLNISLVRRGLCGGAVSIAALSALPAAWAEADPVAGPWLTEDGDSKVEIATSGSGAAARLDGKVVWLAQPLHDGKPALDAQNADATLRARPIMGLAVLSGFTRGAGGEWPGGTIYAPRSGKTYPAALSIGADGRLQIKVKAGLVTKSVTWTRAPR